MHYKNLKNKYKVRIIAVCEETGFTQTLFSVPVEDFGSTAMRVIKDAVAIKLSELNKQMEADKESCLDADICQCNDCIGEF